MMVITHVAIATAGASLLLGTAQPLPLALAVLGSQLPDIDTTTSIIGQVVYPISSWINARTRADGRYLILDAVGNEFVVTDGQSVYQTGKQLLMEKLTTTRPVRR